MITYKKLKTFIKYNGDIDLFIRSSWFLFDRTTDSEFVLIEQLLKEARMLQKNEVSPDIAEVIRQKITENCDNQKTIEFLYSLARNDKFFPPVWFPPSDN
ncbi:MAG TPA: hypothetical protein VG738_24160 [Chitinophagaceae bacterium]|nr:hypothetical protein [Chitinophagaceae bacterium]